MKMNKTMLLGEIATRSGIPADECGIVLKTFLKKFFAEKLTRKLYRMGMDIIIDCLICYSYVLGKHRNGKPSGTDHSWNGSGWRLKIPYTVCDSEIV